MSEKIPIGILISGRGSNMSALLEACRGKDYPCRPVLVVSNLSDAGGLKLAQDAGVPTCIINHERFSDRENFEAKLDKTLKDVGAHILCNAGFMRVLTEKFTEQWHDRHLNIHPSLLPSFPGTCSHEQALASGVRITGCTVHYVRTEVDAGPVIAQAATSIRPDDTVETLSARVLRLEHQLYPYALKLVAQGRAPVVNERVVLKQLGEDESVGFFSPAIR